MDSARIQQEFGKESFSGIDEIEKEINDLGINFNDQSFKYDSTPNNI